MEIRTIQQVRIYVLALNTFGRAEEGKIAAISDDYDKLANFYRTQIDNGGGCRDEFGYFHHFVQGLLYNFNPCSSISLNETDWYGFGIHDEWIDMDQYNELNRNVIFIK